MKLHPASEQIARAFHHNYEKLAPAHGYETREESATVWEELPEANRLLMLSTAHELLTLGVIEPGPACGRAMRSHPPARGDS